MDNLVIGGKGFIGSHLLQRFEADCIDLKDGQDAKRINELRRFKPKTIIHLGANLSPISDIDIQMHRTVLEFAKECDAHVIYTSSMAIHEPDNLYAVQKLYGEVLFKDYGILRLCNVFGEGGHGIVDIIKNAKGTIEINGNGEQTRDFISVEDVVDAIIKAVDISWRGIAEIGTGDSLSINELLNRLGCFDYEYVNKSVGIRHSESEINNDFPWKNMRGLE